MSSILREPLLHFFVLGAAVFVLFALLDDTPQIADRQTITVTIDDARRLVGEFEATWRRPPNAYELDDLIARYVQEEVYVREASALGLDRDDAIIRRRLQMKMEFLTEAGAQAADPDEATLAAHLDTFPERFERPPLIAFEQIVLGQGPEKATLTEIRTRLENGQDISQLGRPSLLPASFPASPPHVIDGTFGSGFFDTLTNLPVGEWAGPITTSFGRHLVRITERRNRDLPALAEIRDRVVQDWRATLAAKLREERFEAMRQRYEITQPEAAAVLGQ
jgi:hypothetical protein